jgi:RimJ/RimL family protein N-acetyltransferase
VEVPRLQSRRLLLREWREGDVDAYAEMYADPEVMRFLGGPVAREQAWRHMALLTGHWALRGYGQWLLERRDDGRFVGALGADALISIIAPENAASARVARRLGMTPGAPSRLQGGPVVIWQL